MYKFKECLVVLFLACTCSAQHNFPAVQESYKDSTRNVNQQNINPFNQQQYVGRHLTKRVADPSGIQQGTMDSYLQAYKDQHDHFQYQQEAKLSNTNTKRSAKDGEWRPITKLEPSNLQFDQSSRYGRSYQPEVHTQGLGAYKSTVANALLPGFNKYFTDAYPKHETASPVAIKNLNLPLKVENLNVQLPSELQLFFKKHGMNIADYQAFAMLDTKPLNHFHHPVPPVVHHQVAEVHHQQHHQFVPQVHHQIVPQVHHQVVPQVHHQVSQVHHEVLPQAEHHVAHEEHHALDHHALDHHDHQQLYKLQSLLTKPLENDHHVSDLSVNVKESQFEIPALQQHHGYDSTGKEISITNEHKVAEPEHHQVVYQPTATYGVPGHSSHGVHHEPVALVPHTAHGSDHYHQAGHHQEDHAHVEVHHELPTSAAVHAGYGLDHEHGHHDDHDSHHYASNYAFGYRVVDHKAGNDFGHKEEKKNGITKGHYHALLPDGRVQNVKYYADKTGYHASLSYDSQHQHEHEHPTYGVPHH